MRPVSFAAIYLILSLSSAAAEIGRAEAPVPGAYIVVLHEDVGMLPGEVGRQVARLHGGSVKYTYSNLLRGFSLRGVSEQAMLQLMAADPRIAHVEEVGVVKLSTTQNLCNWPTGYNYPAIPADVWGLDLMDGIVGSRNSCSTASNWQYSYCSTGLGVRAYVVDTGVLPEKFALSQVEYPATMPQFVSGAQCWNVGNGNFTPEASHGTSVASVLAGPVYGVAKDAKIVDVRAFDCGGSSTSDTVIAALEWIPTDPNRGTRSVVNLSFEFRQSCSRPTCHPHPMATAVNSLVTDHGIMVVAAGGNESTSYRRIYPAGASQAIAVGGLAIDKQNRWSGSNYGINIDIYAPAQYVESDTNFSNKYHRSELANCGNYFDSCTSGTSFAAPFVAGATARYLQNNPGVNRTAVMNWLQSEAAQGYSVLVDNGDGRFLPIVNITDCP